MFFVLELHVPLLMNANISRQQVKNFQRIVSKDIHQPLQYKL